MRSVQWCVGAAVLVVAGFAGAGVASAAPQQSFATCDEARAAGFVDIERGDPGYVGALDPDADGVACESDTTAVATTAEVLGAAETAPAAPAPAPAPQTTVEQAPPEVLANTGTTAWILTVVALVLVVLGYRVMQAGYERLDWIGGTKHRDVRFTAQRARRRR